MNSPTDFSAARLRPAWARWARRGWWLLLIFNLAMLALSVAGSLGRPLPSCALGADCAYVFVSREDAQVAEQLGLPAALPKSYEVVVGWLGRLALVGVGLILFWRRPDDWVALCLSATLTNMPLIEGTEFTGLPPLFQQLSLIPAAVMLLTFAVIPFVFPTGRHEPRWTRWFSLPAAVLLPLLFYGAGEQFTGLANLVAVGWMGLAIFAMLYRYRYAASAANRQQLKWTAAGFAILLLVAWAPSIVGGMLWPISQPSPARLLYFFVSTLLIAAAYVGFAVCFGVAILRHRLWDIDFLINRSLVYGALTALLAAFCGLSLMLIHALFQDFAGGPVVAVAAAALVFGLIFQPARRRLQRFVDRRFYHIEVDYQQTPVNRAPAAGATSVLQKTEFGDYQGLELIGRGGMAEVYKSVHPTLGAPVAIKILPAALAAEPEFQKRFTREAEIASRLQHPHITRVFDYGAADGVHYMVMEYVAGPDLGQYLAQRGRLPAAEALPLLQAVAGALDYAHAQGLVHRDIKPSNILLNLAGGRPDPKLADFGIAKILSGGTRYTRTGGVLGTFDYMAPEQIQETANLDGRADVYALGVMVYQILTGELPFKHANPGALLIAHLTQPPPDPCDLVPELPGRLGAAVRRAMAKDPEERFASAAAFGAEMAQA